jgi:hypothetical protein
MRATIMVIAAGLITDLVVGYNLNSPPSPEIRRAIPVNRNDADPFAKYVPKSDEENPFSKYAHPRQDSASSPYGDTCAAGSAQGHTCA